MLLCMQFQPHASNWLILNFAKSDHLKLVVHVQQQISCMCSLMSEAKAMCTARCEDVSVCPTYVTH